MKIISNLINRVLVTTCLVIMVFSCSLKDENASKSIPISVSEHREYKSDFGFTIKLPRHWLVMNRQEVMDSPSMLDSLSNPGLTLLKDKMPYELFNRIIDQIKTGRVEYYFNIARIDVGGNEHIVVSKGTGRAHGSAEELNEYCNTIKKQGAQYIGEQFKIYRCEMISINGSDAIIIDTDGMVYNTRNVQWRIQKSPGILIMLGAMFDVNTLQDSWPEINSIVNTISFEK